MLKQILMTALSVAMCLCTSFATVDMHNNNYGTYGAASYFDNGPYFTTNNLWHTMPAGAPQVSQFAASRMANNTFLYRALDPSHNVWEYNESWATNGHFTFNWVQHPEMGTDNGKLALGFGKIYKLTASTNCHTAGEPTLLKWSGSAWVAPVSTESCSSQIAVGDQDGTLGSRTSTGHLYVVDPGATVFVQLTGGASTYQSIAVGNKRLVLANDSTGKVYQRNVGANTMALSPFPNTPEASGTLVLGGNTELLFRGASGKVYIYNGKAWVHPLGYIFGTVSTAGPMNTFATVGTTLYRFTESGLAVDVTTSGNAQCPPTGCPVNSTHTPRLHLEFKTGSLGALDVNGAAVFPTDEAFALGTVKSFDTWNCAFNNFDPVTCFTAGTGGTVTCSVLQIIYQIGVTFINPPPPTFINIQRRETSCVQNSPTLATLTVRWAQLDVLGREVCYPKPASSWEEGSMTGNTCSYYLLGLEDTVTKNTAIPGGTIHQKWAGSSSIDMVPDCLGVAATPIWTVVDTTTTRP